MFVKRPKIAMLKNRRILTLELLKQSFSGMWKALGYIFIIGFQKIRRRNLHLDLAQLFREDFHLSIVPYI